jgi:peptidoglycan hydrolase CwlO-like protein
MKHENDISSQIQTTSDLLARLEAEQADFQNRMTLAVGEGDSASMIDLKRRHNELPVEIEAARIRLAKLHLQSDEERLPALQAEVGKFYEPIQEAIAKRDAAALELGKLQGAYHGVNEDLRDVKNRIGERKRELERLIYQANPAQGTARANLQSLNTR